jgi:signal transduction histidine kinase
VSQALYAILLGTHTAQRKLDSSPGDARQALEYVENLAQAGIKEMRALIFVLRPESLENEGLTGVLRKQLDVLETRHGIDATLDAPAEPEAPFATKQALYRIAQEALHNVVKHARATHVRVSLAGGDGNVRLTVADDGVGFDPQGPGRHGGTVAEPTADHLGLRSMQERARQILGALTLTSHPGEGTTITVVAPCEAAPGAAATEGTATGSDEEGPPGRGPA